MGNEMPNRNVLADAEQDNVDNQTSQVSSAGSVGPKVEDVPKSTPSIEVPKDDLVSGSKEETVIHKDTSASVEVDHHVQALKSEENPQKSTHEVGVLDVSADKSIGTADEKEKRRGTHERSSVPDEEAIKSKHGSSVNEELSSIDTNVPAGKSIDTAEEKEKQIGTHERAAVSDEEVTKSKHASSVNEELLSIENRSGENPIANAAAFAKETFVSDDDSITTPNGLQRLLGTEQAADVSHLPQKTMQTEENGLEETTNGSRMGGSSTENEKVAGHFFVSEMNSGFIHGEKKNDSEETMASSQEKLENPTSLHSTLETEKQKQEKQEAGISQVEAIKDSLAQQSASEEGETNLTVIEVIQESITLLSNKRPEEDKGMNVLQELKNVSCDDKNSKVSAVVEELEKPALAQSTVEVHQNEHDKGAKTGGAEETIEGLSDSQSLNTENKVSLAEAKDNSWCTPVILSGGEIQQQTQKIVPEPFVPPNMNGDIAEACSIHNKEIAIASIILNKENKALQSQNDLHSEEALMGTAKGDRINNFESEVNKADAVKCSISTLQLDSSETKDDSNEVLQSVECFNKMDAPQKREDISGNSSYEVENNDMNGLITDTRSSEDGRLLISDNELLTLPVNSMKPTANELGEPGPDLANESFIPTGEKTQVTSFKKQVYSSHPDHLLQSPDYVNCPKLESWHEESGDDSKTPLLATAEGSPVEKKESVLPSDSNLDEKVSLERTESEKLRAPLRHLLTDDSAPISKQSAAPTEQRNAQVKSAEDVWESPARLVASPSKKDKQKTRSIFSQCMCCPAAN